MRTLPNHLSAYKKTPVFAWETVPASLTRDHSTKAGTWGLIHVLAGTLELRIPSTSELVRLAPGTPGVIEPEVPHRVVLEPATRFYVEFYR